MRVSIDSTEPLEDALRVVGALYGVTLTVAQNNEATTAPPATTTAGRGGRRPAGDKATQARGSRRGRSKRQAEVSNAELRSWARENSYTVSDRGRVPATVTAAYHAAHTR